MNFLEFLKNLKLEIIDDDLVICLDVYGAFICCQLPPHMMAQVSSLGGLAGLTSPAAGLGHLTASQLAAVSQAGFGGAATLQVITRDVV